MFNYDNLYDLVFDKKIDADRFVIISGYIGPAVIQDLKNVPYNVEIYVGMYGNNVNSILHNSLLKLNNLSNVSINYTKMLVHAKCYIWYKNDTVVRALVGSANFSTSGLMTPKKEVLGVLPTEAYDELRVYNRMIQEESYSVTKYIDSGNNTISYFDEFTQSISEKEVNISLLASRSGGSENIVGVSTLPGMVHSGAGLNWGFSNGLPKPNDAYIKIPKEQIRNSTLLFPPKSEDINEPIDVVWDDGTEMQMLLEGCQDVDGKIYPKQIGTYKNKSELGLYLRKRIGEKIGVDLIIPTELSKEQFVKDSQKYASKLITKEMLDNYGRTFVTIKLIGEKTYYFDFSSK